MSIRGGDLPRLAMANWDHGWLIRRDGRQVEYRSLARSMRELAERGYNALRVDVFPHLIASRPDGVVVDRFDVLPGEGACQVQPRKLLLELAGLAREHDIRLWLTSRFLPDTQARRNFVRRPRDFVDVWLQTLDLLRREGLVDVVAALDFCHEFTSPQTSSGAFRRLFGRHPVNPLARLGVWSRHTDEQVEAYLREVPRALRAVFPEIAYGVSASASTERQLRRLDTTELDFLDSHMWLEDNPAVGLLIGSSLPGSRLAVARALQSRAAAWVLRTRSQQLLEPLGERLEATAEFARLRRLQPVVGAGFVRLAVDDQIAVPVLCHLSEALVEVSLVQGFRVLVPTVQARPENIGLWSEIEWHRRVTGMIRHGSLEASD